MATDMLRLADDGEGFRGGFFANGEIGAAPASRAAEACRSLDLRTLVERAVIPRLHASLNTRGAPHPPAPRHGDPARAAADRDGGADDVLVDDLIDGLLADDLAGVCRRIDAVRACGRPLGRIYIDLLTPVAVRLSRLVADDLCSTAAGTIAFCNLQLVLRRYAADFYGEGRPRGAGGRALLVSPAADTEALRGLQVFGLLLAADFLRREGWEAWAERSFRSATFKEAIFGQWFDLVEVLAGDDDDLDEIASGIRTIRRGAVNPHVGIVACGRTFIDHPHYVRLVGADGCVADPLSALPHLSRRAGRRLRRPC